MYDCLMMNKVE